MVAPLDVVVPATVAVIGTLFAWQSNKRLAQDREQSEARLAQDRKQSEARLQLDAVIHAADLFNPSSDPAGSAARCAAGLLVLTQLDQADLAVALVADLWGAQASAPLADAANDVSTHPTRAISGSLRAEVNAQASIRISAETAIQVINAALKSKNKNAQVIAAELLCRNAETLDIGKAIDWPSEINGKWDSALPVAAKLLIVDALVHMALASKEANALRELAIRLYSIWKNDPQPRVKGCIAALLNAILPELPRLGYRKFLPDFGDHLITIEQMQDAADHPMEHPDEYFEFIVTDRSVKLAQWAADLTTPSTSPGRLAPASAPL